ncbi:MAG: hypothetical protein QXT86_12110 [Archaeoglobaceae archaeon]
MKVEFQHDKDNLLEALNLDAQDVLSLLEDILEPEKLRDVTTIEGLYQRLLDKHGGKEKLLKIMSFLFVNAVRHLLEERMNLNHLLGNCIFLLLMPEFTKFSRWSVFAEKFVEYLNRAEKRVDANTYMYLFLFFLSFSVILNLSDTEGYLANLSRLMEKWEIAH